MTLLITEVAASKTGVKLHSFLSITLGSISRLVSSAQACWNMQLKAFFMLASSMFATTG
jgi:hypothetical protein